MMAPPMNFQAPSASPDAVRSLRAERWLRKATVVAEAQALGIDVRRLAFAAHLVDTGRLTDELGKGEG